MKNKWFLPVLFLPLLIIPAYAQEVQTEIPPWVKGVANFWAEGGISDSEFAESITFLIEQGIIEIESSPVTKQITMDDQEKRLYDLEIANLENEVKEVGLDNAHLLNSIVNLQDTIEQRDLEIEKYKNTQTSTIGQEKANDYSYEFDRYREMITNLETVNAELENKIHQLEEELEELD